jgi:hypothetical protein
MDKFGESAPRLFEWYLAPNDPFAALVHETRFREVIDGTPDRGTRGWRVQANTRDHAGGDD